MSSTTTKTYTSGDPRLAIVDDEAEQAPKFDDPYEERKYLKHRLALAFRVFANFGLAEGVAGHITIRDPVDCNSFWVNPFGMWLVLHRVAQITAEQRNIPLIMLRIHIRLTNALRYAFLADSRRRPHSCRP